jgi:hypothetical protein
VTETIAAAVITLGVTNTERELGITYRQLDFWCRLGLLHPLRGVGTGNSREWTRAELEVARTMGHLVRAGAKPALAERIARSRRCEIAPGTWLHLGPALSEPCGRGDCEGCFPEEPSDCGHGCHGPEGGAP